MNPDGYTMIFNVANAGFKSWWFPAFGLIFVGMGLALPRLFKMGFVRPTPPPDMQKWFPRILLVFAILWTSFNFITTFADYRRAVTAMQNNRAKVVEGLVMDFKAMPYTGHAMESFVVRGVRFEYADNVCTAGFNNTASHGGPIREGLPVKIWYLGGEILRLDIKQAPNQVQEDTAHKLANPQH